MIPKIPWLPLRTKLAVPIGLTILVLGLGTAALMSQAILASLEDELHRRALTVASEVSLRATQEALVEDTIALDAVIADTMTRDDVMYVVVIGAGGYVLTDSFDAGIPGDLIDVFEIPRASVNDPVAFDSDRGIVHDYVAPMVDGRLGTVHLGLSQERVRAAAESEGRRLFLFSLFAALATAVMATVLTHIATQPVRQLTVAAANVASGRLDVRSGVVSRDEIGDLAEQFDDMVAKLETSQSRLRDAHKMMVRTERLAVVGQVASGIAHEIGNPLHAARQFVDALSENPDAHGRYLPLTREALDRIDNVISEMLGFTRERSLRPRAMEVNAVVTKAVDFLKFDQRCRSVELEQDLVESPPPVHLDPESIGQVVVNLVVNSLDALEGDGRVVVKTAVRSNGDARQHVVVTVQDDGPGIAPQAVDRIFEPFYTTKDPGAGTGLGLAVSQRIVTVQGGRLEYVESPGAGATFEIWLPAEERT